MLIKSKTTYLLMERGVEDVAILNDLQKLTDKYKQYNDFIIDYPALFRVYLLLKDEMRQGDE